MTTIKIGKTTFDLQEVASKIPYKKSDSIFASGSVIEGCGNEYSDIDYFLILDDSNDYDNYTHIYNSSVHKVVANTYGHVCVNYEVWKKATIEEFINQINKIDFDDLELPLYSVVNVAPIQDLKFLTSFFHRMFTGKSIINEGVMTELGDTLNKEKFYKFLIRNNMKQVNNMYDDVLGNLSTGRIGVAAYVSREMLTITLGMYLNSMHITVDRNKWILDKLENHSLKSEQSKLLLKSVNQLLFFSTCNDTKDLEKNAKGILMLTNEILEIIAENHGGL